MDSKRRLMFSLEDDYYYITLKILLILRYFECHKKPLVDYKKLSILFEVIKDEDTIQFINYLINKNSIDVNLIDNDKIIDIVCNAKVNTPIIKRILFFLESKKMIELSKNNKKNSIDVNLVKSKELFEILENEIFFDDVRRINIIKDYIPNTSWIKFTTFKEKLFNGNEVAKWDD